MEVWVSGPALTADHARRLGESLDAAHIAARAQAGDPAARATLDRHADRLARGLAAVVNVVDPDVIVIGGGLSQLAHLYEELPQRMGPHIFGEDPSVRVVPPRWGDASGVRGAAWLWPPNA
jgi:fructokinase